MIVFTGIIIFQDFHPLKFTLFDEMTIGYKTSNIGNLKVHNF